MHCQIDKKQILNYNSTRRKQILRGAEMKKLNDEEKQFLKDVGIEKLSDLKDNENEIIGYIMNQSSKNNDIQKNLKIYNNIMKIFEMEGKN